MNAEGWYQDPYGVHEARWFSDGTPTALVRDGRKEGRDTPPAEPATGPLVECADPSDEPTGEEAFRRAEDPRRNPRWMDLSTAADLCLVNPLAL